VDSITSQGDKTIIMKGKPVTSKHVANGLTDEDLAAGDLNYYLETENNVFITDPLKKFNNFVKGTILAKYLKTQTRTQITGEKAGAVAFAIEEQVLKNIKPSLAKAFELTKEENHENAINILDEYKQTTHGMHEATSIDQKVGMHQIDMLKKTLKESSITKKL
jgi:hypothetical protein